MTFLTPSSGEHTDPSPIIRLAPPNGQQDRTTVEAGSADLRWTDGAPPVFSDFTIDVGGTDSFCLASHVQDIYFRLYLDPQALPFGVVGGDTSADLTIWNAQITPATITAIDSSFEICDADGVPVVVPFVLGETELLTLTVKVPGDGPAGQSEDIEFTLVSNGQTSTLIIPVSLLRVIIWHYPPQFEQWQQSFTFKTAITTTENGTEQRHSLTPRPTMTNVAEYWAVGDATQDIRAVEWSETNVIAGDWSRVMVLDVQAIAGQNALQVKANDVHFHPNQRLIIIEASTPTLQRHELVEVAPPPNNLPTTVALANVLEQDWPPGTLVVPAHFATFDRATSFEHRTNCFYTGDAGLLALDDIELPPIDPPMLNGIPVFDKSPDWTDGLSGSIDREHEVVEGVNTRELYEHYDRGRSSSSFDFVFKGQDQIREMLGWIGYLRGRWKSFYMPTWVNDLNAVRSNGTLFTESTAATHPDARYNRERGRDAVYVARGNVIGWGQIIDTVITGDTAQIFTEPPLPSIMEPGVAGYLQEVRMESDTITINFRARDVARLTFNVRTV